MKRILSFSVLSLSGALASLLLPGGLQAADISKAANTDALDLGSSWVGGVAPTGVDRAVWDSTVTSANTVTIGGGVNFGGIQLKDPGGNVTINAGTGGILTLGAQGLDLSSSVRTLTIGTNINVAADQTWTSGSSGAAASTQVTLNNPISGTSRLTVASPNNRGFFFNAKSTYSGGTTVNGLVRIGQSTTVGTTLTNGALGVGNVTLNSGATLYNSPGITMVHSNWNLAGDITLGISGTAGRFIMSGTFDLGGATRAVSLVRSTTLSNLASGLEAWQLANQGSFPPVVQNGTLSLSTTNTSTNYAYVRINSAANFINNAGLTIGDHVITGWGTGTPFNSGANAPAVTVNSGGIFNTSDGGVTSRNLNVYSLAGDGKVSNLDTDGATSGGGTSLITLGAGTATFSGTIEDGPGGGVVAITKNGANSTQTFSGANTYSGATTLTAGALFVNGTHTVTNGYAGSYTVTGATLGGNGTIDLSAVNLGVTVNANGKLDPGATTNSVGTLTLALGYATLSLSSAVTPVHSGALKFDLGTIGASDKIVLTSGSLDIGYGVLELDDFAFTALSGLQAGTYTLIQTPNYIAGSLGANTTGVIGAFNAALGISADGQRLELTLAAPSLPIPVFSNLTPSQTILLGTPSLMLTGKLAAPGPVYPPSGESGTVSATINGTTAYGTFTDSVGDFSIAFDATSLPASATPYAITYSFAGDARLSAAADNSTTTLTVSTNLTWTGAAGTNFEVAANWNPAVTPASDLTSQVGVFGTLTANQPALTASRSIGGLSFTTPAGGWTLGSSSADNVLSLGSSGLSTVGQTSGTNTISANLNLGTNQTWKVGAGGNLLLTGSLTNASSDQAYSLVINNSANAGNVILSPSAGNCVDLDWTNSSASLLQVKSGGMLVLGGDGVSVPATTSTNTIINLATNSSYGTWGINGKGKLQVNSGTWLTGDLGKNGADRFTGTLEVKGGTLSFNGLRYLGEGTINVSGGALKLTAVGSGLSNGGKFALGSTSTYATNTAVMNVSGGLVDLAQGSGIYGGNSIGQNISTLLNISSGIFQNGVTLGGGANGGTSTTFSIGANGLANNFTALTLTGGQFINAGTIQGYGPAGSPGANNLNFMGGVLAARTIDVTYLGSSASATATANQTNSSDNIGTLVNYGGTLAPGTLGVAGLTTIAGSYSNAPGASLAIDLGGTTAATAFTNAPGAYDTVVVTNEVALDGSLNVSLIEGFIPQATDAFVILTASNSISGTFTNLDAEGRVAVQGVSGASFQVVVQSEAPGSVMLTNFVSLTPPVPPAPTAGFTAAPASGVRPLLVSFTNDVTTSTITNLLWVFGDGATVSTGANAGLTHLYTVEGSYSVSLVASGPGGATTNTVSSCVNVAVPGVPQVTSFRPGVASLVLQGTNGPVSATQTYNYWLRSSTNLALPRASWPIIATNAFNASGSFSNSIPTSTGEARRFYLIEMP